MRGRAWHGNVRELRNAIERAQVVARAGVILPEHLPAPQSPLLTQAWASKEAGTLNLADATAQRAKELLNDPRSAGSVYQQLLREIEGPLLSSAMQHFDEECAPAARALGLHRTTLKKKLEEHELSQRRSGSP
uniref:helix-turn-helix domain-containing protein n=1 Tax=Pirellulimonas nuda TaxID=2528009 RepID=UPI001E35F386|nr:helix-turn-helix domain-containing protein [Pirellulimonas nuda]